MPKLKETQAEKLGRIFRSVIAYNLAIRCEDLDDLVVRLPCVKSTFYKHLRDPMFVTVREMLCLAPFFTDRQLCEMFGVEYHGATGTVVPEGEAAS